MKKLEKLLIYLKELNIKPELKSFENRLIIQKTACLLKMLGFDIKYKFSMYVRGPYSPDLTKELYKNDLNNFQGEVSKKEKEKLKKFKEITEMNPKYLELMTTYAFLEKEEGYNEIEAKIKLKQIKSFYSDHLIAIGISKTKELFYNPTEEELKEMKEDFKDIRETALENVGRFL